MKLINHTLLFLSALLFVTASLWAVPFYFQLHTQIKKTVDDGLANYKIVLIDKLKDDSAIVQRTVFKETSYIIKRVTEDFALKVRDSYKDTLIYSDIKKKNYRTRLLTTAFVTLDNKYYEMKVISQELDNSKLIREIATSLLWLFLFLFISTIFINNLVLKKTWKPFYKLLNKINEFKLDKGSSLELPDTKIIEFSLLNKSVGSLLKANFDIFNRQKQFIENASHELQTPLAIGINKLELLAGENDLSPAIVKKIENITDIFQRLTSLNKSLLLLTKIENMQFVADELLNLDEIISKILDDFSEYSEFLKIRPIYLKEDSWFIKINKDLANILVINLVKNAIIYNRQGGEVLIKLSSGSFIIENTSGDPVLAEDKLFERFNKNSKSHGSTGLGLAIVKAIVETTGLSIHYAYNGRHIFKISSSGK